MKKVALAAVLTLAASSAFAGNMAEPIMEPTIIEDATTSSSNGGILVPLVLLVLIAAAAS